MADASTAPPVMMNAAADASERIPPRRLFAFLIMVFDFIDRQIVVSMFPALKTEWQLSDKQLGALLSVVSITVGFGSLPVPGVNTLSSRILSPTMSTLTR